MPAACLSSDRPGASINELVTAEANGALVPIDDSTALARAMLQAWRGEPPFDSRPIPPLAEDFEPSRAAENLLEYVRLARPQSGSRQAQKETAQAVPASMADREKTTENDSNEFVLT